MRLKTKFQDEDFRLGEVIEGDIYYGGNGSLKVEAKARMGGYRVFYCKSLKELNDLFEDYGEPKEYWTVDMDGDVKRYDLYTFNSQITENIKSIGNYFSSKEEAKLVVRKLKAWKRLKDKGFRFNKWTIPEEPKTPHIKLVIEAEMDVPDSPYDLDLLFSGGEE